MHFSTLVPVFLATLVWLVAADTAVSFPGDHVNLPKGSSGAAYQLASGDSRAYYVSAEGAIHELAGTGDPERRIRYSDIIRIPANKVRDGSPIAVAASNSGTIRIYYIGRDNNLKEYCYSSGDDWSDCALNTLKVAVKLRSNYLYAAATPYSDHTRVGYECVNGNLCEAYYYSNNVWRTREL